ncbi:MAG TPA: FecR family protein [Candidatus Angelobacter sp.]|nr:FecR family protein [Candidatus Angelobacter sp.]
MFRKDGLLITVILGLALLVPYIHADDDEDAQDSHVRIVRLSYADGDVQIQSGHDSRFENATLNVPITEGDRVRVGLQGWAEIQLEDGSTIRLAPRSEMSFTQLSRLGSGGTVTAVDLSQGEAEFYVKNSAENQFELSIAGRTVQLQRSVRFRAGAANSDPLQIAVWKGEVGIRNADTGETVAVKKNETFYQDISDPGRYDLEKGVEEDDLDAWSQEREDYLNTYARNSMQSPYQSGLSDMNYYGQYQDVPGYGTMWQPNGVDVSWNPYMNGYWSFVPGPGYTWISSYPWGWMPYRCGFWIFIPGRGWLWQSDGCDTGWHRAPVLRQPPKGFIAPPTPPVPVRAAVPGPGPTIVGMSPGTLGPLHGVGERRTITNDQLPMRQQAPVEAFVGNPGTGQRISIGSNVSEGQPSILPATVGRQPEGVHPPTSAHTGNSGNEGSGSASRTAEPHPDHSEPSPTESFRSAPVSHPVSQTSAPGAHPAASTSVPAPVHMSASAPASAPAHSSAPAAAAAAPASGGKH